MSGDTEDKPKHRKSWTRRIASLLIGLAVSLVAGAIVERVGDAEWLEEAKEAQSAWMESVSQTSPIGVATMYWSEVKAAYTGDTSEGAWSGRSGSQNWLISPVLAFAFTIWRFFADGGITAIVQIGLGALAVAAFNFRRTNGDSIFFDGEFSTFFFGPAAIIVSASLIGMALWVVMIGALYALSWVTGFAAAAAAATGIGGFAYLCVTKLAEKGIEHVATPKV